MSGGGRRSVQAEKLLSCSEENNMAIEEKNVYATGETPSKDWFLQFLVNLANKNQFEQDITLTVGGVVISGTLIGVRQYFDDLGDYFAGSFNSDESSEQIRDTFQRIGEQCSCVSPSEKTETPSYIHMKNVRLYNIEGKLVSGAPEGVMWRGRISEVQGFAPGLCESSGK